MATSTLHVQISRREQWRTRVGLSEPECRCLVAVIAAWSIYGKPVLSSEVNRFLVDIGEKVSAKSSVSKEMAALAKRGWVKATGKVVCCYAYVPTERGYRILGLSPRKAA